MEYSQRKHPRLKKYDYSLPGYYYVTIHAVPDAPRLSRVGRGLAPAGAVISLSAVGEIAEQQLFALEKRYFNVLIDKCDYADPHSCHHSIDGKNARSKFLPNIDGCSRRI